MYNEHDSKTSRYKITLDEFEYHFTLSISGRAAEI